MAAFMWYVGSGESVFPNRKKCTLTLNLAGANRQVGRKLASKLPHLTWNKLICYFYCLVLTLIKHFQFYEFTMDSCPWSKVGKK